MDIIRSLMSRLQFINFLHPFKMAYAQISAYTSSRLICFNDMGAGFFLFEID